MTGIGLQVVPFDPACRGADFDDAPAIGQLVLAQPVVHGEVAVRLGAHVGHQLRQVEAVVLQSGSVGKKRGSEELQNYAICLGRRKVSKYDISCECCECDFAVLLKFKVPCKISIYDNYQL